jgi:high frequency lysogenization protein
MTRTSDKTLALAAVYQAAVLADSLARTGTADSSAVGSSLYSLFQQNPETTEEIYAGIPGVGIGPLAFRKQLTAPDREHLEVPKYALTLLHLASRLMKEPAYTDLIGTGIEEACAKLDLYDHTHSNQIAAMADLYKQTVSQISPRIMIKGEPLHLQNPETQNRIRALLLAGIRSAILWKQLGGTRLQLLFGRKRILAETETLLQQTS